MSRVGPCRTNSTLDESDLDKVGCTHRQETSREPVNTNKAIFDVINVIYERKFLKSYRDSSISDSDCRKGGRLS
jgi:hypothetical protein